MSIECGYCIEDNHAHSFKLIDIKYTKDTTTYMFKSNISECKMYNTPSTIINHINKELIKNRTVEENRFNSRINFKYWYWEIDFKNTSFKHYTAYNTIITLSKWIANSIEARNLIEIKISNCNFMISPLLLVAKLYLPSNIKIIY